MGKILPLSKNYWAYLIADKKAEPQWMNMCCFSQFQKQSMTNNYKIIVINYNGKWSEKKFFKIYKIYVVCMDVYVYMLLWCYTGFSDGSVVKNLPAMQETWVRTLGQEDPLEKGMATHSSVLAWEIPWTEEPGGLQSMGLWRIGHDWVTKPWEDGFCCRVFSCLGATPYSLVVLPHF